MLMPKPEEYYLGQQRVHRKIGLWALRHRYAETPYGNPAQRRREALEDAAEREDGVFSEVAKMALERWSDVRVDVLVQVAEAIVRGECRWDVNLVAVLGMLQRYGSDPSFPGVLREVLEERVLRLPYSAGEQSGGAMSCPSASRQILWRTAEVLAGQLFPDRVFTNSGRSGQWHLEVGEQMVSSWCHDRAMSGFGEWDSHSYFADCLVALSHLADLANTPQVYEWATVIMDKMLFSMALNSYRGVFGSSHGRACASMIKGGHLEATAGVGRLMWGMGTYNHHTAATVSLACAKAYELPPHILAIAADLPDEMWNRERHVGEPSGSGDRGGAFEVNKVTYKTPDYMLCSAQDHYPGQAGDAEHVWQATMGPDAVVFVTHPSRASDDATRGAGFWRGNGVLPRVAQWKDVLIAIHELPEQDWMGYTHAYFPTYAFDEYVLRHGWAFARKGEAYLALTASQGLNLVCCGDSAYRELRSYGRQNIWLCHMGRTALDGDFGAFQAKMLARDVAFEGPSVEFTTLRGERLAFGWEGHLLRDGRVQEVTGFKQYENDYCVADLSSEQMDIIYKGQLLRLSFAPAESAT